MEAMVSSRRLTQRLVCMDLGCIHFMPGTPILAVRIEVDMHKDDRPIAAQLLHVPLENTFIVRLYSFVKLLKLKLKPSKIDFRAPTKSRREKKPN